MSSFVNQYRSKVKELVINSKPLINSLTMIASESIHNHAADIASVICDALMQPRTSKLPLLYLMDSIIKNVKGIYVTLFAERITLIFDTVFQKEGAGTRTRMQKLLKLWREQHIFDDRLCSEMSQTIERYAPSRPANVGGDYPNKRPRIDHFPLPVYGGEVKPMIPPIQPQKDPRENEMMLVFKEIEHKLSIHRPDLNHYVRDLKMMIERRGNVEYVIQELIHAIKLPPRQKPAPPQDLLSVLNALVVPKPVVSSNGIALPVQVDPKVDNTVKGMFSREVLTRVNDYAIEALYKDMPIQCHTCGLRYADQSKMEMHMDFHFRFSQREERAKTHAVSREWWTNAEDWVASMMEIVDGAFFQTSNQTELAPFDTMMDQQVEENIIEPKAPVDNDQTECPLCGDQFEQDWDDDLGVWMYQSCVRVDENTQSPAAKQKFLGQLLHYSCLRQLPQV